MNLISGDRSIPAKVDIISGRVGRLTIQAIGWRDYSILQASVMFIVLAFLVVNLLTDLTYGLINPRIRYE